MNNISTSHEILHGEWRDTGLVQTLQQGCMETYRGARVPEVTTEHSGKASTSGGSLYIGEGVEGA
jgi:hypothetical protein